MAEAPVRAIEETCNPLIRLRNATVVREGVPILDGLSLKVDRGEHTAILGPNGSGKSTLIRLLTGEVYPMARPDAPAPVSIFGRERWNLTDLRRLIGFVSNDLHQRFVRGSSLGHVTGLDAVIAGFLASEVVFFHHEVTEEMRLRARSALERVDSGSLAARPMHRMSTGEVRRILIARALVHDPPLLLMDEPTSGLDLVARHDFLRRLRGLAADGTTLILVTHHVEEIIPEITRVVLLDDGRIAADGPVPDVLTSARLSAVFGSPLTLDRRGAGYELRLSEGTPVP